MQRIIDEHEAAAHGMKEAVLRQWARRLSPDPEHPMSTQTLYRHMRKARGKTKEAPGRPREIPRDGVRAVIRIKERAKAMGRADTEREYPTDLALKDLAATDPRYPNATEWSESTVNRIAREELGYRDERRTRRFEAEYATRLYQMDFSRLEYFQLKTYDPEARGGEGDYILHLTRNSTAHKTDDHKVLRAWIVSVLDDASRVFISRAFAATGESPELGLEFLRWVFLRDHDEHPLRYPPQALQADKGAFASEASTRACEAVGIDPLFNRGKGSNAKVERTFRTLWTRWEQHLAMRHPEGWTINLTDLNATLFEFSLRRCRKRHPTHRRHTREDVYITSLPGRARTLDTDLLSHAFNVRERTVTRDGTVSLDNELYITPHTTPCGTPIKVGARIRVLVALDGTHKGQLIATDAADFELKPFHPNGLDDFAGGPPATTAETLRGQVDLKAPLAQDLLAHDLQDAHVYAQATGGTLDAPDVFPRPKRIEPTGPFAAPNDASNDSNSNTDTHNQGTENGSTENGSAGGSTSDNSPTHAPILPAAEARAHIGRQLRPYGATYADVASVADDLVGHATRSELDELIHLLTQAVSDDAPHAPPETAAARTQETRS